MIVVSDSSPINYLVLVGHIGVLPVLFGQVVIPPAVFAELQSSGTPQEVHEWVGSLPAWLTVLPPAHADQTIALGVGEVEAISLAVEMRATLLLADDQQARRAAEARGVAVVGTLGVFELAAERRLIELPAAIAKLRETNFHVSEEILARILAADAARRPNGGP